MWAATWRWIFNRPAGWMPTVPVHERARVAVIAGTLNVYLERGCTSVYFGHFGSIELPLGEP